MFANRSGLRQSGNDQRSGRQEHFVDATVGGANDTKRRDNELLGTVQRPVRCDVIAGERDYVRSRDARRSSSVHRVQRDGDAVDEGRSKFGKMRSNCEQSHERRR